jgi:SHS2 domain-containing protein
LKYRRLDHTSDLGLEIFGCDLPELFRNAAYALFDNMLNLTAIEPARTESIDLSGETTEELFLNWLRELLFRFATAYFAVRDVPAIIIKDNHLHAEIQGEQFDPARHQIKIEIKTPTYHMFAITGDAQQGFKATVILDV